LVDEDLFKTYLKPENQDKIELNDYPIDKVNLLIPHINKFSKDDLISLIENDVFYYYDDEEDRENEELDEDA